MPDEPVEGFALPLGPQHEAEGQRGFLFAAACLSARRHKFAGKIIARDALRPLQLLDQDSFSFFCLLLPSAPMRIGFYAEIGSERPGAYVSQ